MKETYCVFNYCDEFVIMDYQTFKENQYTSVVHFIGTYQECEEFIVRSTAAQELVNSANREYEDVKKLQVLVELLEQAGVRKYTCINGWDYSQLERDIVSELTKDTYTREEVRMVALNSINNVLDYMLKGEHPDVTQIINSKIDTVKLF